MRRLTIAPFDVLRANLLVALGDVAVLRHGSEQNACFLRFEIEAVVLARRRICITVRVREQVLRLDGVKQREREQIPLTGESRIPALESFFAHPPVRVCDNQVSLADHVERARRSLHCSK